MKIIDITSKKNFTLLTHQVSVSKEISGLYACDLLSFVMSHARENNVLLTVVSNFNTLAVASLLNLSCIIFVSGVIPKQEFIEKAEEEKIALLTTPLRVEEAILRIHEKV